LPILVTAAYASFIATFNETFLNVALTPIMNDFGVNAGTVQWVTTAYMLMAAIMVPLTGFLYRKFPTKPLTVTATALLLLGSVLGLLSPNFPLLIVARVVQALGTGMLTPIAMNVVLAVAPRNKIGTYMGLTAAMTTLGPACGPIVSGFLLAVVDWHLLFGAFAALVAVALVLALVLMPNVGVLSNPKLDVASMCMVSVGLVGLLYGITSLFEGDPAVGGVALVVGVAALALFVHRQGRIAEPFVDLRPFTNPGFNLGIVLILCALMVVFSMNIILPMFMQGALGYTALEAALTLLPACILSVVLAPVAGRVYDRIGLGAMALAGTALVAVFAFALSHLTADSTSLVIVLLYAPIIIGVGLVIGPSQSFALSRLDHELYPHGVTVASATFQVGGSLGSSLFVGVLGGVQAANMQLGATEALVRGFSVAALVAMVVALVGVVAAVCVLRLERRTRATAAKQAARQGAASEQGAGGAAAAGEGALAAGNAVTAGAATTDAAMAGAAAAGIAAPATDAQLLAQVMNADVYSVPATASVYDALEAMVARHTSGLPVLDADGRLVGFVSDGDIMRSITGGSDSQAAGFSYMYSVWNSRAGLQERATELRQVPVLEVATRRVVSIERGTSFEDVCAKLAEHRFKKLPVTQDGKVVGTLSRSDLMRYLASMLGVGAEQA
jgi:DHA2 family lincomycin resistance protein-like MFS transporter